MGPHAEQGIGRWTQGGLNLRMMWLLPLEARMAENSFSSQAPGRWAAAPVARSQPKETRGALLAPRDGQKLLLWFHFYFKKYLFISL